LGQLSNDCFLGRRLRASAWQGALPMFGLGKAKSLLRRASEESE
jgi:hypothetical protein